MQSVPQRKHITITKIKWLTLFKEIIAVYPEDHRKPINTLCGQNAELGYMTLKQVIHIVKTGL
jgi:hypothetical protein